MFETRVETFLSPLSNDCERMRAVDWTFKRARVNETALMANDRNDVILPCLGRVFPRDALVYGKSRKAIIATKDGECFLLRAGKMHEGAQDIYMYRWRREQRRGKARRVEKKETERREFVLE